MTPVCAEETANMNEPCKNERGAALVLALTVLTVLALMALLAGSIVVTEMRTDASGYSASRSFYSADAATEAGVNWIRQQLIPAAAVDSLNDVVVNNAYTTLKDSNRYRFNIQFLRRSHRPGWGIEYKDYEYRVDATGASAVAGEAGCQLGVTRLYREGY